MKILIVAPRYNLTNKANYNYSFPVGLGYISSVLKKAGHDVDCLNMNHCDGGIEEIMSVSLAKNKYDVICTGHMAIGYQGVKKIIDSAKKCEYRPKVILGGAIVTSEPDLMFESLGPDYAVLGEGEDTVLELLKSLEEGEDLRKVKGIMFRGNSGVITTAKRDPIQDLDSLPFPDFEGLGLRSQLENSASNDLIQNNFQDSPRSYPILCSRCCPFDCTFCYHSLGKQYRKRSISNIMQELELAVKNYKINNLFIYDDLFSADRGRLYEFCAGIKKLFREHNISGFWFCQLSVNNIDRELLVVLKDAGCCAVSFGFESMSPIVLKSMKKPIVPAQIDRAINLCMEEKTGILGNFIFGDVAETRETAYETLNYWKKNCKGQVGLDFIQPYPGSAIYDHCVKKGIIKDRLDFIKNIGVSNFFNMTEKMPDAEVERLKFDMLSLLVKYQKSSIPSRLKKMENGRYEIRAACPYCGETPVYRNFYIKNRAYFDFLVICKNCKMRFIIYSFLKKLIRPLYPYLQPFKSFYNRMRNSFLKKNL